MSGKISQKHLIINHLKNLDLFSVSLTVGRFNDLITFLLKFIDLPRVNSKIKPISLMVVSMQDLIANLFHPKVAQAIQDFDLHTPDGMPLVWLANILGFSTDRMYGPDIMEALLTKTANKSVRHYFYGGTPELLVKLKFALHRRWPKLKIAGMKAPPFRSLTHAEKLLTIQQINLLKPDIVWVGLGSWKQLLWAAEFKPVINTKIIIPVGMALDLMAGQKTQAPVWLRQVGGEWLFRLLNEPFRLWSRYLWQVPFFGMWWLFELGYQMIKRYVRK